MPVRIAVLASGGGTNLQALIDRFHSGDETPARVELVVASRAGIGALARAEKAGIPSVVLPPAETPGSHLLEVLERYRIELVVLAGYLRQVPDEVVTTYRGRMLNVHPALLPAFGGKGMYGMHVHRAVLAAGVKVTGATVHLVDEHYDQGPILAQWPVPVLPGDDPETLAARVLRVEHLLLPLAVEAYACGGPPAPLTDPLAFELLGIERPSIDSVARLAAATCKPVADE